MAFNKWLLGCACIFLFEYLQHKLKMAKCFGINNGISGSQQIQQHVVSITMRAKAAKFQRVLSDDVKHGQIHTCRTLQGQYLETCHNRAGYDWYPSSKGALSR